MQQFKSHLAAALAASMYVVGQPALAADKVPPETAYRTMEPIAEVPSVARPRPVARFTPVEGVERRVLPASTLAPPIPGDYQARIRDDHERHTLYFSWMPANVDPHDRLAVVGPEASYRVCLFIGDACEGAQTRQVFEFVPRPGDIPPYRYRPSDDQLLADLAFQESTFNWSVAACLAGNAGCSPYTPALAVEWSQARLPVLRYPGADARIDPMLSTQFRWDATADVDHYLLCLGVPEAGCTDEPSSEAERLMVIALPNDKRHAYLEELLTPLASGARVSPAQRARLHGQHMRWSVAVCRDSNCAYRQPSAAIHFDRGLANFNIRNISRHDVNGVWLLGPGDADQTLVTHDLSTYLSPGTLAVRGGAYDDNYLVRVNRHHLGIDEPGVKPYYRVQYQQVMGNGRLPVGPTVSRTSAAFAPGISPLPDFKVERETLFITDQASYLEQLLRGPDNLRYVYRPAGSFEDLLPGSGPGPVQLTVLREVGYRRY